MGKLAIVLGSYLKGNLEEWKPKVQTKTYKYYLAVLVLFGNTIDAFCWNKIAVLTQLFICVLFGYHFGTIWCFLWVVYSSIIKGELMNDEIESEGVIS